MFKKLFVMFLSIVLIIGIMPVKTIAYSLGSEDACYIGFSYKIDKANENAENIVGGIAESPTYRVSLNLLWSNDEPTEDKEAVYQKLGDFSIRPVDDESIEFRLERAESIHYATYVYATEGVPSGEYYIYRNGKIFESGNPIKVNNNGVADHRTFCIAHYMDGDTEIYADYNYIHQGIITPITPPVKPGYVFDKWVTQKDGDTEFDFSKRVKQDVWIYASYKQQVHEHQWSNTYAYDESNHWHECNADGCPITENSGKDGFGAHTYGQWTVIKEPTCTEEGIKRKYCTEEKCGAYMDAVLDKVPHEFETKEWKNDSDSHWHECKNCHTATTDKETHRMSKEPVIKPATQDTPGLKTWKCEDCGYLKTEEIPVIKPEEKPTTQTPEEKPTTQTPEEKPTTQAPEEKPTTQTPEEKPTTQTPEEKPDIQMPEEKPTISAVEEKPTVVMPVSDVPDIKEPVESPVRDEEPQTGEALGVEMYATLAMIAGMAYLMLYFTDGSLGMTEEEKKELIKGIIGWTRGRGRIAKYMALSAIFVILLFYHSIGKKVDVDLKAVYNK